MIWRIILWASLIWLPLLMYKMLGGEAKFTKNIAVGVTLPFEGRSDDEVTQRLGQFRKELRVVCIVLAAVTIPCMFVKSISTSLSVFLIWTDLCIVLPYIPYIRCNRDLKRIKHSRGWVAGSGEIRTVDLGAVQEPRGLPSWSLVPAVPLALLPLAFERSSWAIYAADALGAALCLICFRIAYRRRAELVDGNTDLTNTLTRIRQRSWDRLWLVAAYGLALMSWAVLAAHSDPIWTMIGIMTVSAAVVTAVLCIEFKTRTLQARLTADSGTDWYADEDAKWLGGLMYYDPNDMRTVVNCRVGSNTTVNLARPGGRVLAIAVTLLLLALPFCGAIIDAATNRPVSLEVTETQLTAYCGSSAAYEIELADISQAELLDELPTRLTRTFGTGAEHLLKGNFTAAELGSVKLCLDPTCPPFLLVRCTDGTTYIFGSQVPGESESICAVISR